MVIMQLLGMCKTLGLNPSTQPCPAPLEKKEQTKRTKMKQTKKQKEIRTLKKKKEKKVVEGAKKRIIYNIKIINKDLRRKIVVGLM